VAKNPRLKKPSSVVFWVILVFPRKSSILLQHILAMVILSFCPFWCLSWCLSRPGTVPSWGEIKTSEFHHMIALVICALLACLAW